jgi:DNA-3-methyladenine glycosylase
VHKFITLTLMSAKNKWRLLGNAFYQRNDVVQVAKDLLGKLIITDFEEGRTIGRIVETEAYAGVHDKASHAYNNRRTKRTEVMYMGGGTAYVYLCYGIHHLFNVVTNVEDEPHAVLIRGIEPIEGIEIMMERMGKTVRDHTIGRGPGNVSKALGIHTRHSGVSLRDDGVQIVDDGFVVAPDLLAVSARIGVDYAAEDSMLPYRFYIRRHPSVSGKRN